MAMLHEELRARVAAMARVLHDRRLVVATAGNVSARVHDADLIAITPSGVPYAGMRAEDVVLARLSDGAQVDGTWAPSTELPLHRAVYAERPDVGGIVHTHSLYATMLGVAGRPLKPVHYAYGLLGEDIRTAPYVRYGTEKLACEATRSLGSNGAVLLQHHGAITVGHTVEAALERAEMLEWLAQLQIGAEMLGPPLVLTETQMAEAREALVRYGPVRHDAARPGQ